MAINVLTKQQVIKRIEDFCKPYKNYSAAAKKIGCTDAQLSDARRDIRPPCPSILEAIGVKREYLYATGVEDKHRDGAMADF